MPRKALSIRRGARQAHRKTRRAYGFATKRLRILPSFLVLGAQRAGTTSLFYYLSSHPDVARPATKEIHFFDDNYWHGADWYRAFFALSLGGARATGEATPYYLFHPAAPARVAATIPDVKLVTLLRNPVDRAYSHYHKMRRMGIERLSFQKALAAEEKRLAGEEERLLADPRYRSVHHRRHAYVARGLYADQLERWLAFFPHEQLLVLLSEDFFARPAEVYLETLDFLGLPPWKPGALEDRNPASYKPLGPRARAALEERFAEPNARLARLLGRDVWPPTANAQSSSASSSA